MQAGLTFHHLGYATHSIEQSLETFALLGYAAQRIEADEGNHARLALLVRKGSPDVELVEGLGADSPVKSILDKSGVCPYHVCYESDAFESAIAGFRKNGFSLLFRPRPALLFDGRRICYLYHKNMGLLELLEKAPREG
jgi:methylmalonyl-CoA/ethylmalonyl-CoA epimerase